tara:strand:+ start:428 stop:619 length:192 start_codon:yes stop_codon:yes gene_type:complete
MSLTEQVETSLRDAQSNLRNALAFAARSEEPYVNKHIADMLTNIDALISVKDLMDKVDNREEL